jgi:hypothetical protein
VAQAPAITFRAPLFIDPRPAVSGGTTPRRNVDRDPEPERQRAALEAGADLTRVTA